MRGGGAVSTAGSQEVKEKKILFREASLLVLCLQAHHCHWGIRAYLTIMLLLISRFPLNDLVDLFFLDVYQYLYSIKLSGVGRHDMLTPSLQQETASLHLNNNFCRYPVSNLMWRWLTNGFNVFGHYGFTGYFMLCIHLQRGSNQSFLLA